MHHEFQSALLQDPKPTPILSKSLAIALPIYRSLHTPEPRNPKSLKKMFLGLPTRSVKKVSKKSPNTDFVAFLTLFRVIRDFFDTFLTLQAGRSGNTFLRLLGISGPEGLGTPAYMAAPIANQLFSRAKCRHHVCGKPGGCTCSGSWASSIRACRRPSETFWLPLMSAHRRIARLLECRASIYHRGQ